jgi:CRISPR-associated RAMP protein (TIGR02581 family)
MLKRLRSECIINFDVVTTGPLLIKSGQTFATGADMTAVRTMRNGVWEAYIPGSSLKGAVRAQAERIARTLAVPGCCDPFRNIQEYSREEGASCSSYLQRLRDARRLDALPPPEVYQKSCSICKLFGSLWQVGRLAFNDAHLEGRTTFYERSNVGIDRRTGGVASGPFEMEVVPPTTRFHTSLYLRNFELWQLGLLAFVLRDFEEGVIKMGMGKSRGLGQIKGEVGDIEIRYLGLYPQPLGGSPCQLRGIKSLEPDADYGFAAYGASMEGQQAG